MSQFHTIDQVEKYPERDGKPVGETDLHIDWIFRIRDILRLRYQGQRVYVGNNLLVYYQEGTPSKFVVPDGFVVLDCDPQRHRTYKLWEEGKPPDVVIEITSRSSKHEDQGSKPLIYAEMGVTEYFLYDPGAEYLEPPLQGFRLEGGSYERIQRDADGSLCCQRLGITLGRQNGELVIYDTQSGKIQETEAEAAETQIKQLQAELERLQAALRKQRSSG